MLRGNVVAPPKVVDMVSETGVANVTASGTLADSPPYVAVIFVLPLPAPAVAKPEVLMVATLARDDDQVGLLMVFAVPSE